MTVQATDNAGNVQSVYSVPLSSLTFAFDNVPPNVGIVLPQNNAAYSCATGSPNCLTGASAINGTASSPDAALYPGNNALQDAQVVIWFMADPTNYALPGGTSYYYTGVTGSNGTKFSSSTTEGASWQAANSTATWDFLFTGTDWINEEQYFVKARATDNALNAAGAITGNTTSVFANGQNLRSFIIQNTPPVSQLITPPPGSYIQSFASISGTANVGLAGGSVGRRIVGPKSGWVIPVTGGTGKTLKLNFNSIGIG